MCPAPPKFVPNRLPDVAADDHRIYLDTDDASYEVTGGEAQATGHVTVHQDDRSVTADAVTYERDTGRIIVKGAVDFLDPKVRVRSDAGSYESDGAGSFDEANFQLMDRLGRGFASKAQMSPGGVLDMKDVRYTTCPVGNEDWLLKAKSLEIDTKAQQGVARDVVMRFKDVPIFYTPYISFPLGDDRKSGVLFPSFGHSGNNGYELQVPYYFNLAPNYDLTVTPGVLTARGFQIAEEFRFLTANSHGNVDGTFLPDDRKASGDNRSYVRITDTTDLQHGLRFDADISSVSDSQYFSNFAVGSDQTSVTYLERRAEVLYYDDVWRVRGELQNYQTIDVTVLPQFRPYSRVPRIDANALLPLGDSHFEFALDSELVNFLRNYSNPNPSGLRLNLAPELRWSLRGPGYFFEPAVGYDFTQYDLQDVPAGLPNSPTRSLPYARVDAGLVFERTAGAKSQRTQTLEPRIVYSYVPYRNQDELPIFDTALPDLNLTELFRTNRYVGSDRIGDANQLALALTTRLFDNNTGTQYLSATIGQIRYFDVPRVGVPVIDPNAVNAPGVAGTPMPAANPLSIPGALIDSRGQSFAAYPGQYNGQYGGYYTPYVARGQRYSQPYYLGGQAYAVNTVTGDQGGPFPASDIVTEVSLTGYKHLSVNLDYQWNPYTSQTEKSEISLQYRPDGSRVINLGYRFQNSILKQIDTSFAWPLTDHFNAVGRWVYSLLNQENAVGQLTDHHQTIEQVVGIEYKSCCYHVQLVQRRYVTNRLGGLDTSIALQLELTGLSTVGKQENTFLERSIRGYSTRDPNTQ
jgi:lipopolysaccharide assembly outer membrane protein LptD (OstA)